MRSFQLVPKAQSCQTLLVKPDLSPCNPDRQDPRVLHQEGVFRPYGLGFASKSLIRDDATPATAS